MDIIELIMMVIGGMAIIFGSLFLMFLISISILGEDWFKDFFTDFQDHHDDDSTSDKI